IAAPRPPKAPEEVEAVIVEQLLGAQPPAAAKTSEAPEDASRRRDAEDFLEQLITGKGKQGASAKDPNRDLYDAVWQGDFDASFDALEAGATTAVGFGRRSNTALHVAARTGHPAILGMLLNWEGAPKAQVDLQNEDGETPLFGAVIEGNVGATQALVDARANLDMTDNEGKTVLAIARARGRQDFVEFLTACGAAAEAA
ncbi:unnamed protein product, partial [Polarella glacialis]